MPAIRTLIIGVLARGGQPRPRPALVPSGVPLMALSSKPSPTSRTTRALIGIPQLAGEQLVPVD